LRIGESITYTIALRGPWRWPRATPYSQRPTVSVPLVLLGAATNSLSLCPSINASFAHGHEADPIEALAHFGQRHDIRHPGDG